MRTFAALKVFVYSLLLLSAAICRAEDWASVHARGLDAADKRDFERSVDFFRKSVPLARTNTQKAVSANDLGVLLHQTNRDSEAKEWLVTSLSYWKNVPGSIEKYAETAQALAMLERLLGDYRGAESLLRSTIALQNLAGESKSGLLAQLGDLLREEGRFVDARVLLLQARNTGGVSPHQQIDTGIALAELDRDTANWDASIDEWNKAAALARESQYPGAEAVCERGLGETWVERGNNSRGEPLLRAALAKFEAEPVRDDAQIATTLASLGDLYLAESKTGLAEEALDRALEGDERCLGSTHPQVAMVLEALAHAVAARNEAELARNYMSRAEKIMEDRFGEHSFVTAGVLANWAAMEQRLNNPAGAAAQYRKALDTLQEAGPELNPVRARIIEQYAVVLKATHHKREAQELLAQGKSFH